MFVGIDLDIKDNKILTKHNDKRDSFTSEIASRPFFNNNVPSKVFYSSIGSEILRLARNTSDGVIFIMEVNKLFDRISKQGK